VIEKQRKIYRLDHIKIHLDKLPNDEEFIELEAIDPDDRFTEDELKTQCLELKSKLNIQDSDLLPTGYFGR
jgi:adenylate cyclase class IV